MKVIVDQDLCISCGLCVSACEEVFFWNDDDKAESKDDEVASENKEAVQESIDGCPTEAIKEV